MTTNPIIFYYFSFLAGPLFGLLQTKVLTHLLAPAQYAQLQLVLPVLAWIVIVGGVGLPQYIVRFHSRLGERVFIESVLLSTSLIGILFIATIIVGYLAISPSALARYPHIGMGLMLALFATIFANLLALVRAWIRASQAHRLFNVVLVAEKAAAALFVSTSVYFFILIPVEAYLSGILVSSLIVSLWAISKTQILHNKKIRFPGARDLRTMLGYGAPTICVLLLSDLLGSVNRFVLADRVSLVSVASFSIATMITTLALQVLYEPILSYMHPRIFPLWESGNRRAVEDFASSYFNSYLGIGAIVLGLVVRSEDVLVLLLANARFRLFDGGFFLLALSAYSVGVYRILVTPLLLIRRTGGIAVSFLGAVVVSIALAYRLVDGFGVVGVSMAVFVGSLVLVILVWVMGRGIMKFTISWLRLAPLALLGAAIGTVEPAYRWSINAARILDLGASTLVGVVVLFIAYRGKLISFPR